MNSIESSPASASETPVQPKGDYSRKVMLAVLIGAVVLIALICYGVSFVSGTKAEIAVYAIHPVEAEQIVNPNGFVALEVQAGQQTGGIFRIAGVVHSIEGDKHDQLKIWTSPFEANLTVDDSDFTGAEPLLKTSMFQHQRISLDCQYLTVQGTQSHASHCRVNR
jgi:hypothetical protein